MCACVCTCVFERGTVSSCRCGSYFLGLCLKRVGSFDSSISDGAFQSPEACFHHPFVISCLGARARARVSVCMPGEEEDLHRKFEEEKEEEAPSEGIPFVWTCVPDYISSIFACCSLR